MRSVAYVSETATYQSYLRGVSSQLYQERNSVNHNIDPRKELQVESFPDLKLGVTLSTTLARARYQQSASTQCLTVTLQVLLFGPLTHSHELVTLVRGILSIDHCERKLSILFLQSKF